MYILCKYLCVSDDQNQFSMAFLNSFFFCFTKYICMQITGQKIFNKILPDLSVLLISIRYFLFKKRLSYAQFNLHLKMAHSDKNVKCLTQGAFKIQLLSLLSAVFRLDSALKFRVLLLSKMIFKYYFPNTVIFCIKKPPIISFKNNYQIITYKNFFSSFLVICNYLLYF